MNVLSETFTREIGRTVLSIRKDSPTLFLIGGVAGMVTSTVLACRATLKLEEILDEHRRTDVQEPEHVFYTALSVAKLYAPSVIIGSASIGMLTQSHNILLKRNAALTAAYTALDKGFRDYRARVVAKYGPDADTKLRYGVKDVVVKNEKDKNVTVQEIGPDGASIYARFFDQFNPNWSKDPEISKLFLKSQQNYLNDLLHARGHLFLNEVYDSLGFEHSQAGSVVGWILHPDHDNFIDFGVFHAAVNHDVRAFVNGDEPAVLLDFNVDGLIYDKIDGKKEEIRWQRTRWFRT
jgi:hypothetical protein